ncbi:Hypothetical predicted protein [Octopus vulgaris]|uniref:Uncharacterized protein n=1 Tax=Octopus vulgaris TaxID=6645 RepID=A0AA36AXC1_OCTVU|nr:Hypothetical predicted protein [Octopus vulgaris]
MMTEGRSVWKQSIYGICKEFEARRIEESILKRALRCQDLTTIPDTSLLKKYLDFISIQRHSILFSFYEQNEDDKITMYSDLLVTKRCE